MLPPTHRLSIGGGSVKLSSNLDIMDVIFASMAEKNLKGRPKNARSRGGFLEREGGLTKGCDTTSQGGGGRGGYFSPIHPVREGHTTDIPFPPFNIVE